MKRYFLLILSLAAAVASAQVCPPQAGQFITERILNKTPSIYPFDLGFDVQRARTLGDCAAVALISNLRLTDLDDPRIARLVVQTLQYAFSEPRYILVEQQKQPRAALLLLDIIAGQASDAISSLRAKELLDGLNKNPPEVPRPLMRAKDVMEGIEKKP